MSDFVKRKMEWLVTVATDKKIHKLPLAVAVKLGGQYFNNEKEKAWPSVARLADELQADSRNVRRAIRRLVDAGYLLCETNRGRGYTNQYRLPKRGYAMTEKGVKDDDKRGSQPPPDKGNEPKRI